MRSGKHPLTFNRFFLVIDDGEASAHDTYESDQIEKPLGFLTAKVRGHTINDILRRGIINEDGQWPRQRLSYLLSYQHLQMRAAYSAARLHFAAYSAARP